MKERRAIQVALIARATLYTVPGGDTIQITQTARFLNYYGIKANIHLTNKPVNYKNYDLLHFFNIMRPADILFHIQQSDKPYVVSPIFVDYSSFDKKYRRGLSGFVCRLLTADQNEYIKTILRWLKGNDQLTSIDYLWKGQTNTIKFIISKAAALLPNSVSEYDRLLQVYQQPAQCNIVPNGVDISFFKENISVKRDPNLIICAARIEGIKNQLTLIKALNNTKYQLLLIGSPAPNQLRYYKQCKELAASNISFIEHVSQEKLREYYQRATIHILPSWFETTGLSSLEAAVMGCKIIVTAHGDTRDYFGEMATYCDPSSAESILQAVETVAAAPFDNTLRNKILANYTWQQATEATLNAYYKVIPSYESTHRHTRYPWHT
jgi:glycosyltransferase involved in cell wall biosynthesis